MTISDQEVWLRAYCAAIAPTHHRANRLFLADDALSDFRKRFPTDHAADTKELRRLAGTTDEPAPVKGCWTCEHALNKGACDNESVTKGNWDYMRPENPTTDCPGWTGGAE